MSFVRRLLRSPRSILRTQIGPRLAARRPVRTDLPFDRWGLTVGPSGTLTRGSVDLAQLAEEYGTPLHLVDATALDRNADEALAPLRAGNGADMYYSYKTNPIPAVVDRLHRRGLGAEVISPFELWLAGALGVPPERIIYNGPAKSARSIHDAIVKGVRAINANSLNEANLIRDLARDAGVAANLGVRVAVPGAWGGQFGVSPGSRDLDDLIRGAALDQWTDLVSLHAHRGRLIRDEATWRSFVGSVLGVCDDLRDRTGWHPRLLDLGGSLACPTVASPSRVEFRFNRAFGSDLLPPDPDDCLTLRRSALLAAEIVGRWCDEHGLDPPSLVQEPGRAMTGDTQLLLTTVVDVKLDGVLPHAVLDAGINIAEPLPNEFHQLFSVTAPSVAATRSCRLAGPICTPADVLYNNWRLPDLQPGHVLAIMDTGAYFVPFSTEFSFPRPAIVMQDGTEVRTIRSAEQFVDLVGLDLVDGAPITDRVRH
ncbi:MAG: diaminopimelate decarboxylase family protein [Ilumatobacteraceae bacterium]